MVRSFTENNYRYVTGTKDGILITAFAAPNTSA
jgi:hypothetical protein